MTARIIDGRILSDHRRAELAARTARLEFQPSLTVILVGDDPASATYVRSKDRAAVAVGINAQTVSLPSGTSQAELLKWIAAFNADAAVDGILVQLPLPPQIDPRAIIEAIDPAKDVDGFHPFNAGQLALGRAELEPCTPRAVMALLAQAKIPIVGARAVIVGRSSIVGRPLALMMLAADATVTIAHSRTRDLMGECTRADILIAAVGRPELITGEWIAPGATVIDVGINRLSDGRLVGDVAFSSAAKVAGAITPVPGGVGPMTISCLLENTLIAAERRRRPGSAT